MSYRYYDIDIHERWKVQLRGWPIKDKFVAPENITTMHEIRILHEALKKGECQWVQMTQEESTALATSLKENPIVKTRKSRKKRGNENTNEGEETQAETSKKKRKSRQTR